RHRCSLRLRRSCPASRLPRMASWPFYGRARSRNEYAASIHARHDARLHAFPGPACVVAAESWVMPPTRSLAVSALVLACCPPIAPARAQLSRTFVSAAIGSDANNCDRPTPCRSFQGAHDKTNPDGEITVLDTGGYGTVAVTKSISIVNDGIGEASILVS